MEQVVRLFVNESDKGLIEQQEILRENTKYITNTVMKVAHTKAHVALKNTMNHEVNGSNIYCTLQSIDANVKLINQNKLVKQLKIDH